MSVTLLTLITLYPGLLCSD